MQLGSLVGTLRSAIADMKELELDTTEYQGALVAATGELSADTLNLEVILGLIRGWVVQARDAISENWLNSALKVLVFAAIIFAFRLLAAMARRVVTRAVDGSKLNISALLRDMLIRFAGTTVMIIGLLVALSQLGISVGPLLAGLGMPASSSVSRFKTRFPTLPPE